MLSLDMRACTTASSRLCIVTTCWLVGGAMMAWRCCSISAAHLLRIWTTSSGMKALVWRERKVWILSYLRTIPRESRFVFLSLERLGITFTANGKRQIQVKNLSEQKISRWKLYRTILVDKTGMKRLTVFWVEVINSKRHLRGKLDHVVQNWKKKLYMNY